MQGWHAKKYTNKVGMMHQSKGQRIGKAPFLHLFQTTVLACHPYIFLHFSCFLFSCFYNFLVSVTARLDSKKSTVADLEIQKEGFSKFLGCHAHFRSRWKSKLNILVKRQARKIERLYWCLVQQKTLQTLQGSAINKIPNIPQCTLLPRLMCQTLLFDFSRVWF